MRRRRANPFDWSTALIAVFAVGAAAAVYWRDGPSRFLAVLGSDFNLFLSILPQVLAGCLIGVFVGLLLPREAVARWVGAESGLPGLLIATVAGAILPGGPLTIFPVAAAFIAAGADVGAAIAFITGWTLLGYTRALVWELPFFGLDFVLWRILLSIPLPVIIGLIARYATRLIGSVGRGAT
jgi:uncharacterized membrane protein YraQ (UPF0718 family)